MAKENPTWKLTCQECGNVQFATTNNANGTKKCRKCKSQGLDYGSQVSEEELTFE